MSLARRFVVAVLVGGALTVGCGAATAAPLPLETPTPTTGPVAGGLCDANPLIGLWCLLASPSQ